MTIHQSGDEGDGVAVPTHAHLMDLGRRAALGLARLGAGSGNRVAAMLPTSPASFATTLACLRLDAVRISLPLGDHTGWVRHRLRSTGVQIVVVADGCERDGRVVSLKSELDQALASCPDIRSVVVVPLLRRPVPWTPGRDIWWDEVLGPEPGAGVPRAPARPGSELSAPKSGRRLGGMSDTPDLPRDVPRARLDFEDPLAVGSRDDSDEGWGGRNDQQTVPGVAADLARFLDEKPPHHL
ncbi:AMP-binding protein [Streptomyces spiramenti]|uniref:Acetate--CoA ligase n=1 Tax=Streptomyces spiramenti TaxID=2720606 RepID=A0ABX1AGG3_9ACTN|nr:AMP-binding protein [Streptomyces spiramenti]NJP66279.1 acetate--CoA ligase [Streptomyces spiramenti]